MRKIGYYLHSIVELLTGFSNWPLVVATFLGLNPQSPKSILLRKPALAFRVRGPMDIWSVKEAFLDRFYEKHGMALQPDWTVVDVGAAIGEFTLLAALETGAGRVIAFEPFAESYALLVENLRRNGADRVESFPEAVWGSNGSIVLDISSGEPLQLHSLAATADNISTDGTRRVVACVALADRLTSLGVEQVDLLKMDCEGAEFEILFNTPPEWLARIQRIVMEYHDVETEYDHTDMARFLREQGYAVQTVPNVVHGNIGYLYAARG